MKMNKILLAMASVGLLATAGSAFAASALSAASTQQVSLTVSSACTVAAPAAFVFTTIASGAASTAQNSVSGGDAVVTCLNTASNLIVDGGVNVSGTGTQRNLKLGTTSIPYSIQANATDIGTTGQVTTAVALPFSAANVLTISASATPTNVAMTFTLPSATVAAAGNYTDTLSYYVEF